MQKTRQALSLGLLAQESGWGGSDLFQPFLAVGGLAVGNYPIAAIPPVNPAAPLGIAEDIFGGTALAAASTTKAQGVVNGAVAVLDSAQILLLLAGAGTSTVRLQVISASNTNQALITSNLTAVTAVNGLNQGWQSIALTVPAERQAVIKGVAQPTVCLLFPGDVLQWVVATAAPPAGTVLLLDVN